MSTMTGLKYGNYKGFDYVYGTPESNSLDEIINAFECDLNYGQSIMSITDEVVGNVYVLVNDIRTCIPMSIIEHIREEYRGKSYEWFEFECVRDFLSYVMSKYRDRSIRLFMDDSNHKYYARCEDGKISNVFDFTKFLGKAVILNLNESNLKEVMFKEEDSGEKESNAGISVSTDGNKCVWC